MLPLSVRSSHGRGVHATSGFRRIPTVIDVMIHTSPARSRQNLIDHSSIRVGQTEIAAVKLVGQAFDPPSNHQAVVRERSLPSDIWALALQHVLSLGQAE